MKLKTLQLPERPSSQASSFPVNRLCSAVVLISQTGSFSPLDQKIARLPTYSGVYLFKDKKGTILYIGKAGNLRHRVSSYFQKTSGKDVKTLAMSEKVADRYDRHRYGKGSLHPGK